MPKGDSVIPGDGFSVVMVVKWGFFSAGAGSGHLAAAIAFICVKVSLPMDWSFNSSSLKGTITTFYLLPDDTLSTIATFLFGWSGLATGSAI